MTTLSDARRGFVKGSTTYKCRVCGKLTRSTGRGDNENVRLCVACWDAAGLENEHQDGMHKDHPEQGCPLCEEAK